MTPAVKCIIILVIVAICFVTELIPLAIAAMGGAIACGMLGLIPTKMVFSGLAGSTVVLFAGMFVVSAAMFHTGLAHRMGASVVKLCGTSEKKLLFGMMSVTAFLSVFLPNTGATACLMPVVLGICAAAKISPSRQLIPLAYAAVLGGTCSLVGTPPNLIAKQALEAAGYVDPVGFFEFGRIGVPMCIVGILFMTFVGRKFLPDRSIDEFKELLANTSENNAESTGNAQKQIVTGVIFAIVVIVMAFGKELGISKIISLDMAAVLGGLICVLAGCLTEKQAYASIDWVTIFLFGGMEVVAKAMDKTGAGKMIADAAISVMGGNPSGYTILVVFFIISATLTQFMSNTAASALLCPVGIAIAQRLGADPKSVVMGIIMASACSFMTPVAMPPNTLVLGPGKYRFMDYVRAGTGMLIVCGIVVLVFTPIIWPFFPGK